MNDNAAIERSIIKKFRKSLWRPFTRALNDFDLIQSGDHVAVAISGGKDSLLLAKLLQEIQRHGQIDFKLSCMTMDPGYRAEHLQTVKANAERLNLNLHIYKTELFRSIDTMNTKHPCYMCAKMRRGFLYQKAQALGANKLALGHHLDDVVETILMNVLYAGNYMTMMPLIKSTNFSDMHLIRPMYYIEESAIVNWRRYHHIQALDCACAVAEKKLGSKRAEIKQLISQLQMTNPTIKKSILKSSQNVHLDAILGFKRRGHNYDYKQYNQLDSFTV